jgi:hypothetical protein
MATPTPSLLPTLSAAPFDFLVTSCFPLLYSMPRWEVAENTGCELEKFCTKKCTDSRRSGLVLVNAGNVPVLEFTLPLCP